TAEEPHAVAILASDNPKAVVLDLMQPSLARRRLLSFGGKTRRDKASGETHVHGRVITGGTAWSKHGVARNGSPQSLHWPAGRESSLSMASATSALRMRGADVTVQEFPSALSVPTTLAARPLSARSLLRTLRLALRDGGGRLAPARARRLSPWHSP